MADKLNDFVEWRQKFQDSDENFKRQQNYFVYIFLKELYFNSNYIKKKKKMKVVIQRVTQSSVRVNEELISSIGRGLLVFVGISWKDTKEDMDYIIRKILNIKFFDDDNGKKWCKNVMDKQFEILCVSQFTLLYSLKGNKLDFHNAMKPVDSKSFYEVFLESLKKEYKPEMVKNGEFGSYMQVELCNDGPVTIHLDSQRENNKDKSEVKNDV